MSDKTPTPHEVAARWWADQLRYGTKQDMGEKDSIVNVLAVMNGHGAAPDKCDLFESALLRLLSENNSDMLSTDYHPQGILAKAAQEAGVPVSCGPFPMKTIMWIDKNHVELKHGYGSAIQKLI